MGSIFHRLVDTARYDGSYYTSTAAAVILAGLAIRRDGLPDDLATFGIIDPACGTGTLLMAAAERIRDLRPPSTAQADAATLIEDVVVGLDVNLTACHMAATALGMLSPSTAFSRMNIRLMPLGIDAAGAVRLGSLDLLTHSTAQTRFALDADWASGEHIDTGDLKEIAPYSQRLVIMNPPYTRDSLRYDQFPRKTEERLKAAERRLMEGRAGHGSSSGTMFMDLGEHLARFDDGSFAFVYPAAGAAGPSNLAARKLLAEWFWIEWVVASHDPQRQCFSESTNISEVLVVCRRRELPHPPTKFLILRHNPQEAAEAASLVAAVESGTLPAAVGCIEEWPEDQMREGFWRPLGFTSMHLASLCMQIKARTLFDSTPLGEQADLGPAGQRIREAYTKEAHADGLARRALWHNDTGATQSMAAQTDTYIHPKQQYSQRADKYWQQRSRLLLSVSPRLNTVRVNAVRVERPAVGSLWVPARPRGTGSSSADEAERALCAYLNSTLGWVSMIGVASPKVLSRPALSLDALRRMPVPDLSPEICRRLARAFDDHDVGTIGPLKEAASDPLRKKLDDAVADALGIDTETVGGARAELVREPSVNG